MSVPKKLRAMSTVYRGCLPGMRAEERAARRNQKMRRGAQRARALPSEGGPEEPRVGHAKEERRGEQDDSELPVAAGRARERPAPRRAAPSAPPREMAR